MHVIIIGAGTGGLALAHGLKRAGISCSVHERDRTRGGGLQGYRVGIDHDGSRALSQVLPPDLFDTFVATCARTPDRFNMFTEKYREVLSLDGFARASADGSGAERSVSRMTLRQILLTGIEELVHFDKVFTRYGRNADGTVTAHFEDGTSATGDVLVGADGSPSRVRRQYLPHAALEDSGIAAVGGKVPLTDETRALLTDRTIDGVNLFLAPGGYSLILHVMQFPWDQDGVPKSGIGATDADLIKNWPGLHFDNTRDYILLGLSGAGQNLPGDILERDGRGLHELLQELMRTWDPRLRALAGLVDPSTCFPMRIRTSVPIEQWPSSTVTLIGDAIHTMTPGRGVGANTALRDAVLLCHRLTAARDGRMPLVPAIRDYETRMIGYGFDAVRKSLAQMSGSAPIHKPLVGRAVLAAMRTGMRVVNHLPPVKRRMAASQQAYRGQDRDEG
ncbi:FAD-binding monooxygenase [Streptomyces sp. CB02923]|uniref:FAD-dependent oxidoreductase n=1 Tax=Streptomyces sp. CB02923 TaxID=1718985 RepID=UPI000940033C|nr:NAD(P)/FAD-dependent oxidoreductase [Streptomyces sp. CB02923]OKI02570.1 FAD-binding monooxygenase [Streptomyces sp. CB02923]